MNLKNYLKEKLSVKFFKILAIKILIFYGFIVIFMAIFQRNFLYFPFGNIPNPPANFQEVSLEIDDNNEVYAWYRPARDQQKTLLYFHGNAGNISGRLERLQKFATQYGVLAISYRGYPKSRGKASEQNFFADAQHALDFLHSKNIPNSKIIIFGESIGSGVAVHLASKYGVTPENRAQNFASIILEAPFASIADIAKQTYWFLPVDIILRDRFDSWRYAPNITSPVLIFHATQDPIVPFAQGQKLYELIKSPKKFMSIEGNFHIALSPDFLMKNIAEFVQ